MFSGIVSDHWSQATFHFVSETVEGVIKGLQVYLAEEISLEGVEAFIWDVEGAVVANLYKEVGDGNAWVWRSMDNDAIAMILDDHRGRHLMFNGRMQETESEEAPLEMEWDDNIEEEEWVEDEDGDPTMVAVLIEQHYESPFSSGGLFMMGRGNPEAFARDISSRLKGPSLSVVGGVWRLSDGEMILNAHWWNGDYMRWNGKGRYFLFPFEECLGTMRE